MIEKALNDYLTQIKAKYYAAFIIDQVHGPSVISNINSQHVYFEFADSLFLETRDALTPIVWKIEDVRCWDINNLAQNYNVKNAISFFIKIKSNFVVFSFYFDEMEANTLKEYSDNEKKIYKDIYCIFDNYYKTKAPVKLTTRELEILNLSKIGKTYSEIATILGVSERTVRFHTNNVTKKLDASSIKYAIFKATAAGII